MTIYTAKRTALERAINDLLCNCGVKNLVQDVTTCPCAQWHAERITLSMKINATTAIMILQHGQMLI